MLRDYLASPLPMPTFTIDRSRYQGEVLVITGRDDIVFSAAIGEAIAAAYPHGRFVAVRGGHRLELDRAYQDSLRVAFLTQGLQAPRTQALLVPPP